MKRLCLVLGLALGLGLLASEASAQYGSARGKVVDEKGEPVVGAKIEIQALGREHRTFEAETDKKGQYIRVSLRSGNYRFTATKEGYQGAYVDCMVRLGESTAVPDLVLRPMALVTQEATQERYSKLKGPFDAAVALTEEEKWPEAKAAFEKLLEENPGLPEAHYNLAFVLTRLEDWEGAQAAVEKALEERPDYGEAKMLLARIYRKLGQDEKADALLAEVAASDEGDADVQYNLAINLINENRIPEAIAALEKALAANPELADARFHLGTLLVGQGKTPEAIENLEKYLAMNPDNPQNVSTAQGLIAALKPKP
jgi:tetratricopeptide (TPR) repeat protein